MCLAHLSCEVCATIDELGDAAVEQVVTVFGKRGRDRDTLAGDGCAAVACDGVS